MRIITALKTPMLKADQQVLTAIRAASREDKFGWGLEVSEIVEKTKFKNHTVTEALKRLGKKKLVEIKVSNVANHIFFCDPEQLKT